MMMLTFEDLGYRQTMSLLRSLPEKWVDKAADFQTLLSSIGEKRTTIAVASRFSQNVSIQIGRNYIQPIMLQGTSRTDMVNCLLSDQYELTINIPLVNVGKKTDGKEFLRIRIWWGDGYTTQLFYPTEAYHKYGSLCAELTYRHGLGFFRARVDGAETMSVKAINAICACYCAGAEAATRILGDMARDGEI